MLCSRVQNRLSAYCDSELSGFEMLEIRRHLDGCAACSREHRALLRVKRLLGALGPSEPRAEFDPRVLDQPVPSLWLRRLQRLAPLAAAGRRGGERAVSAASWRMRLSEALRTARLAALGAAGASALALVLLAASILQAPQPADAVAAHVPGWIAAEERVPLLVRAEGPAEAMAFEEQLPPMRLVVDLPAAGRMVQAYPPLPYAEPGAAAISPLAGPYTLANRRSSFYGHLAPLPYWR